MSRKQLAGIDLNNQRAINAADPTAGTDLATKQYVDSLITGLKWKDSVRAATTANGALATAYANGQVVDGVTLATNDRILLKNQTTGSENGIYVVNASGAPTRATDFDGNSEVSQATVMVREGTTLADTAWVMTNNGAITIGTTALTFVQFGGGATYSQGNGIQISGGVITAVAASGGGLSVVAGGIQIDTSVVVRKISADVGNGSSTTIAVAHGMGTADVIAQLRVKGTGELVDTDCIIDTTNVSWTFPSAPSSAQYRTVIHS